jgi:hypothetical protein
MKKIYLLFLMVCVGAISNAATKTWIGASGGTWSTGTNWSGGVPTSVDDVIFNTSVTVVVDGTKTVNSLLITNNSAVVFQGTGTTAATRAFTLNCPGCISSIDAGSELTISGSSNTSGTDLTLANTAIFNVNGTLNLGTAAYTGTSRVLPVTGTVTTINGTLNIVGSGTSVSGSAIATFFVNGIQEMKRNGGAFPVATYATAARNIISGAVATIPTFTSSQTTTWGTIEFNAPANTNAGASGTALFSATSVICQDLKVINTGTGNCTIASSGSSARIITVNGDLSVAAGAICNINSTVAAVNATASGFDAKGSVIIDGTLTETGSATGSILNLNGTAVQTVSIAGTISNDVSLRFNNAAGFSLTSNITMPNTTSSKFILTSGTINANNNTIKLLSNSSLSLTGGSLASHIYNGSFTRNINAGLTYVFPIGKNTSYWPVKINNSEVNEFTVKFISPNFNTTGPASSPTVLNNYWDITPTTAPGGAATADISLGYENNASAILDFTKLHFLHSDDGGVSWADKSPGLADMSAGTGPGGCAASNSCGFLDITAYTGPFSPFAIGGALGALPVNISYLNGTKQNGSHNLNWKVNCTSSQNVIMAIERSADTRNFKTITSIIADGVRCLQPFAYTDNAPLSGNNYYRLKTVDENGKITYSTIVLIINKETGFDIAGILPSIINNNAAVLNASAAKKMQLTVVVTDMLGKQVQQVQYNLIAGSNQITINFSKLAAGTYQLVGYTTEGKSKTIRFVKQ